MNSNTRRIFESVVSVEAWRAEFSPPDFTASVHVDVSFLRGKLGDDDDSPVRFEITLKRAEIVFIIPDNEPLAVIQSSVRREPPTALTTALSRTAEDKIGTSGKIDFSLLHGKAAFDATGASSRAIHVLKKQELVKKGTEISWAQSRTANGHYRWEVAPAFAPVLLGKAWDAVAEPILNIKNKRTGKNILEAACRVEIRCRREDLVIKNIRLKDKTLIGNALARKKKVLAVEAYIRNALSSRELNVRNFSDPYGQIQLADVNVDIQNG